MKRLKNLIPVMSLSILTSLSCQAGVAAAPENFNSLADFFNFDASSYIWILIGGAIVAALVVLRWRSARVAAPPMRMPVLQMPAEIKAATSGEASGLKPAHSTEYWVGLDAATTVTVEELSRIEEEAEVFLMMGRPDVAIKVLRDYLNVEPDCKAYVWFKLLDIYHVQDMREPFDGLAQEIRTRFNVALPTWDTSRAEAELRHGLEHFPNLLAKISLCWNDPSGLDYLQGLMQDNRQGGRTGFHEDAFRDLLLLFDVLEAKMNESVTGANRPDDRRPFSRA